MVLPGLNFSPKRLGPLAGFLLEQGHSVALPRLRGYAAPGDPDWRNVTARDWLRDLDDAHAALGEKFAGAAPSLLGVSMGGLLGMAWSLSRGVRLRRAVLIAPPFRLKWYATPLLTALRAALPGRLLLPSMSPAGYALHRGTSLAAYGALLDLLRIFRDARKEEKGRDGLEARGAGAPSQFIAYARADEMISTRYLPAYQRAGPARITLHSLNHRPRPGFPYHLGVDGHTLGAAEWAALRAALAEWLSLSPEPDGP